MKSLDLVKTFYKKIGDGDLPGLFETLDDSISWELVGPETIPYFGTYKGHTEVQHFFEKLFSAETIIEFMPEEFIDGDQIICVTGREKCLAKNTNKTFESRWVHIFSCQNGKIIRWREYIDTAPLVEAYR